jgi:hypothetical protein
MSVIIDLVDVVRSVSLRYGIDEKEGFYLFECGILRLYEFSWGGCGVDIGGVGSGVAFVDFVDRVRRGLYDRVEHMKVLNRYRVLSRTKSKLDSRLGEVKSIYYNRNINCKYSYGFYCYYIRDRDSYKSFGKGVDLVKTRRRVSGQLSMKSE